MFVTIEYFQIRKMVLMKKFEIVVNIFDIRDPIDSDVKFDLVNCIEVC